MPDVSFDGERVAFMEFFGQQDIWIVAIDGTGERRLTDDVFSDRWPHWLDDNQTLYFRSDRGGSHDIWRIRADGGGLAPVVEVPFDILDEFIPSPDGRLVAFLSPDATVLAEVGDSGTEMSELPPVPDDGRRFIPVDWSPDGRFISGERSGVLLYEVATSTYERLTDVGLNPRFIPDGHGLIYQIDVPGPALEHWFIDLQSRQSRKITSPNLTINNLRLLPGGTRALYVYGPPAEADVWLLELQEGRAPR